MMINKTKQGGEHLFCVSLSIPYMLKLRLLLFFLIYLEVLAVVQGVSYLRFLAKYGNIYFLIGLSPSGVFTCGTVTLWPISMVGHTKVRS